MNREIVLTLVILAYHDIIGQPWQNAQVAVVNILVPFDRVVSQHQIRVAGDVNA
jgi:hypothetical protein